MHGDSVDKIITRYFATLTMESFTYGGKTYHPRPLRVSPDLLRGHTCPPGCGGCCHIQFSLDYLPNENLPPGVQNREVEFNGRKVVVMSDPQDDHELKRCRHLNPKDGRCGIHKVRPFSCDFELIRTLEFADESRPNVLTQKLFGRGWAMKRIDGHRGALCEMLPVTPEHAADVVRKLKRFIDWSNHFKVMTWAPHIIRLIETGQLNRAHVLKVSDRAGGFGL